MGTAHIQGVGGLGVGVHWMVAGGDALQVNFGVDVARGVALEHTQPLTTRLRAFGVWGLRAFDTPLACVQGLGFACVQGLGFRVACLRAFRVWGLGLARR